MDIITSDISYLNKRNHSSILEYEKCLEKFSSNFEKESQLESTTPIFIDTNVLLRYYSISFTAREKLFLFIKSNKSKIILTNQVQYEFIKNREDVIEKFFEQVTNRIPRDFRTDVLNKMQSFLDNHKVVLKDYPFVETGIEKHKSELEELFEKLNENSEEKRKERINLIVKDEFLSLLNSCINLETLTQKEIEKVKLDFDLLKGEIKDKNTDAIFNKSNIVFPGLGDIKEKPDDPYGDYIIFHEMMKYMVVNKSDIIFLTFDNTKGDWMTKSKSPYLHYVQNMYLNTNQIVYILDAERTLEEILKVDIQSLVSTEESEPNSKEIDIESLLELTSRHSIFENVEDGTFRNDLVQELHLAGYRFISEIERDLSRGDKAAKEYLKLRGHLNTVGVLRSTLRIVNPNYMYSVRNGNSSKVSNLTSYERYRKYVIN